MAAIKSIKVGETTYDLKATYDGAGNVIDTTYAKANAIPTKISQLQNDSGYLTEHQDISELATKGELEGKVDKELGKGLSEANYTETEKEKLSTIANNANNYVHPTTSGNKHIPSGGASGQMLVFSADGTAEWADSSSKLEEQFTALNEAWEELQKAQQMERWQVLCLVVLTLERISMIRLTKHLTRWEMALLLPMISIGT